MASASESNLEVRPLPRRSRTNQANLEVQSLAPEMDNKLKMEVRPLPRRSTTNQIEKFGICRDRGDQQTEI